MLSGTGKVQLLEEYHSLQRKSFETWGFLARELKRLNGDFSASDLALNWQWMISDAVNIRFRCRELYNGSCDRLLIPANREIFGRAPIICGDVFQESNYHAYALTFCEIASDKILGLIDVAGCCKVVPVTADEIWRLCDFSRLAEWHKTQECQTLGGDEIPSRQAIVEAMTEELQVARRLALSGDATGSNNDHPRQAVEAVHSCRMLQFINRSRAIGVLRSFLCGLEEPEWVEEQIEGLLKSDSTVTSVELSSAGRIFTRAHLQISQASGTPPGIRVPGDTFDNFCNWHDAAWSIADQISIFLLEGLRQSFESNRWTSANRNELNDIATKTLSRLDNEGFTYEFLASVRHALTFEAAQADAILDGKLHLATTAGDFTTQIPRFGRIPDAESSERIVQIATAKPPQIDKQDSTSQLSALVEVTTGKAKKVLDVRHHTTLLKRVKEVGGRQVRKNCWLIPRRLIEPNAQ